MVVGAIVGEGAPNRGYWWSDDMFAGWGGILKESYIDDVHRGMDPITDELRRMKEGH